MKIVKYAFGAGVVIASCIGAYKMGQDNQTPIIKEVTVKENVYIQDTQGKIDAENKLNSVLEFLSGEQKIFAKMVTDMNIYIKNPTQSFQDAYWLAVAMSRECGICNDSEAVFLGYSLRGFLRDKLEPSMKALVHRREANGKYFLSFASDSRKMSIEKSKDDAIFRRYIGYALSILHNVHNESINTQNVQTIYHQITGGKDTGIYWCNDTISACSWHKNEPSLKAIPFRLNYSQALSPIIKQNEESLHTFYAKDSKI
ncbi:MAG: hypothetical protein EBU90_26870 [Proteobacteria bacterium]|nr:hypothetical protein [Pseudomonadota bacterium]